MARKRDQPWLISLQAGMQPPDRYSLNHYYGLWPEREGLHLVLQLRVEMLKNNIEVDVKVKCIEAGKTQTQLAETIGTTGQYVNRIIKKGDGVMNKTFVQMLDALGYDIELHYVKKEEV